MKRYAKYKDSGISWIGEIPEHWNVIPFRSEFDLGKGLPITKDDLIDDKDNGVSVVSYGQIHSKENEGTWLKQNLLRYVDKKFLDLNPQSLLNKFDFVFADTSEDINGCGNCVINTLADKVFAGYHTIIARLKRKNDGPFLSYLFQSNNWRAQIRTRVNGVKLYSVNRSHLRRCKLLVPPPEEQKAIAEFLDNKTKQINELVSAKQKQIELLKEYKQAVIAKAVTQGVNPKTKMKDSGISWIGQIPEHWECSTLRKHLQFVSEKGHPEEQLLSVTREYGVIVRNTESKEENHNVIPEDLSNYKLVKKGQFAINKMKAWQGSYAVSSYTGIVSPAYYVCELNFEVKEFFSMAIRSKAYVPFFTMYSKGIRVDQWDLSPIGLKTIPLFIPPKDEQKRIVTFVNDKMVKIDSQISSIEKQIANLNEYKQSLISDVVTGKVKVA